MQSPAAVLKLRGISKKNAIILLYKYTKETNPKPEIQIQISRCRYTFYCCWSSGFPAAGLGRGRFFSEQGGVWMKDKRPFRELLCEMCTLSSNRTQHLDPKYKKQRQTKIQNHFFAFRRLQYTFNVMNVSEVIWPFF